MLCVIFKVKTGIKIVCLRIVLAENSYVSIIVLICIRLLTT